MVFWLLSAFMTTSKHPSSPREAQEWRHATSRGHDRHLTVGRHRLEQESSAYVKKRMHVKCKADPAWVGENSGASARRRLPDHQ
jgi:hypothetical protein